MIRHNGAGVAVLGLVFALAISACSGNSQEEPSTTEGVAGTASGEMLAMPSSDEAAAYDSDASGASSAVAPTMRGASEASGGGASPAQPIVDLLGRKVIRNGTLDLEVESVGESYDRVSALASSLGGYVAEASFSGEADSRTARLVIRVPAERYDQALTDLRGFATEVRSIASNAQDVTGEVTDLDAALRNLRAVEAQYVELLSRAQAIPDILQVQERLQQVRADIEQTEGRLALLNRLTDLATITVQLSPVPAAPAQANGVRTPLDAASGAWEASLDSLRQVAVVGVAVVVYSWWLVPVAAVVLFVALRLLRQRRAAVQSL